MPQPTNLQQLEEFIVSERWPPGRKLPAERTLAAQLNCSRAALRESLQCLRTRGLVTSKRGARSVVASASSSTLPTLLKQSPQSRQDLLAVRSALDALAAEGAAKQATGKELSGIRHLHRRFAAAVARQDQAAMAKYDTDLHLAITGASHNKVLLEIVRHLRETLKASIAISSERLFEQTNFGSVVVEQHGEIVAAIARRDPQAANAAAKRHTAAVSHRLLALNGETDS